MKFASWTYDGFQVCYHNNEDMSFCINILESHYFYFDQKLNEQSLDRCTTLLTFTLKEFEICFTFLGPPGPLVVALYVSKSVCL